MRDLGRPTPPAGDDAGPDAGEAPASSRPTGRSCRRSSAASCRQTRMPTGARLSSTARMLGAGREIVRGRRCSWRWRAPRPARTASARANRRGGARCAAAALRAVPRGLPSMGWTDLGRHLRALAAPSLRARPATEAVYLVASRSTCSSVAPSPGSSPTVRPSAMTTMRSASASTSGRSDDTTSSATPRVGERPQQAVDLRARADIDAARRLVDDQELRLHRQPLGEQHLLLVAAREVGRRAGGRSAWRSSVRRRRCWPAPRPCGSEKFAPRRDLAQHGRGDVVDDVHAEEQARTPCGLRAPCRCRRALPSHGPCGSIALAAVTRMVPAGAAGRRRSPRRTRCGRSRSGPARQTISPAPHRDRGRLRRAAAR